VVGVHLDFRPRIGIWSARKAGVLGLDSNEIGVTGCKALPIATASVIAPPSGYDKESPIASETKVRQGTREAWPSLGHNAETRHVSGQRSGSVMTDDAFDLSHVSTPAILPTGLVSNFKTCV
jgi:hypothetical protein